MNAGGKLSLIVTHVSGNDISFASKETVGKEPVLKIETSDVATSIKEVKDLSVKVTPNPFDGFVRVSLNKNVGKVDVLSMSGKVLKTQNITSSEVTLSTSDLPAGLYILRVQSEGGDFYTQKMVKY